MNIAHTQQTQCPSCQEVLRPRQKTSRILRHFERYHRLRLLQPGVVWGPKANQGLLCACWFENQLCASLNDIWTLRWSYPGSMKWFGRTCHAISRPMDGINDVYEFYRKFSNETEWVPWLPFRCMCLGCPTQSRLQFTLISQHFSWLSYTTSIERMYYIRRRIISKEAKWIPWLFFKCECRGCPL